MRTDKSSSNNLSPRRPLTSPSAHTKQKKYREKSLYFFVVFAPSSANDCAIDNCSSALYWFSLDETVLEDYIYRVVSVRKVGYVRYPRRY